MASVFFVALVFVRHSSATAENVVSLISVNAAGATTGDAESHLTAISADGRFIAFTSSASNLTTSIDNNGQPDVFLRDTLNNTTTLVSLRASSNFSANGPSGFLNATSTIGISADGRFVVYASQASDIIPVDNNGAADIFVYDRLNGSNQLVSFKSGNFSTPANAASVRPVISANGQVITFTSSASDLSATPDTNGQVDVYAMNRNLLVTKLVSVNTAGTNSGNDHSSLNTAPSISADGRFVAYDSQASDLVANDTNGGGSFGTDVFVRDLQSNTTLLATVNSTGSGSGNLNSFASECRISGNGRFVVFASTATDLVTGISDTNGNTDVFVRDLQAGTTSIVSVNVAGNAAGLDLSQFPAVSFDGRFVAFLSRASNLVPIDTNSPNGGGITDVFVRDMQAGTTKLVSMNKDGTDSGNSSANSPVEISSDGQFLLFTSNATNLTAANDFNNSPDLFLRDLSTDSTTLISKGVSRNAAGSNTSGFSLSDNHQVAFESQSEFLVTQTKINGGTDVFAWGPPPPGLSINNINVVEGDSGTTDAVFTVTLTAGPSAQNVTATAVTFGDTAHAGTDFQPVSVPLTFTPGETTKTVAVPIIGDVIFEGNESFTVELQNVSGAAVVRGVGTCTILENETQPTLSVNDITVTEGDSGTSNATFTVTLSAPSALNVSFGFAVANGTAVETEDFGGVGGGAFIGPGTTSQTVTVPIIGDTITEGDETFFLNLTDANNATITDAQGVCTIKDNEGPSSAPTVQLNQRFLSASEAAGHIEVVVSRSGNASLPATVDYLTSPVLNGNVSDRSDFTLALGTLKFAAGETTKSFTILVTDDAFVEGNEVVSITLSNPTGGLALGAPSQGVLTIIDNDVSPATSNPIDSTPFFVRQHYHDFLNREPDASGLAFWSAEIDNCAPKPQCTEVKRINVSAAFFLSIEFQETGYLVYRMYKAGFGNISGTPVPVRFIPFLRDTQQIGQGVVVNVGDWRAQLEANKQAFALAFVQRPEFAAAFPNGVSATALVDQMNANAGGVLSVTERNNLIATITNPNDTNQRAQVLRSIAEDEDLRNAEFNKAFVLMQYFGYLRRDPNVAPDSDFAGFNFWLGKLNQFNGNFVDAEMVKAFLNSIEYRTRFGP